ncbi:MAG TPA: FtsX-like permease family protein [Gemmatimonadaceae bacterium]|nr:FtsX-like permease family protein [Gemmatimonadaceae bacterium]
MNKATPARVLAAVLGEGAALGAAGIALGLAASAGLARAMRAMLYEVGATDAAVYAAGAAFVLAVAVAATLVPARRATRVDPMVALRAE